MRLLTIAAAALAALLLTGALANAQEPPESQTATRLEPGINLVGWVGEPTSTSQLFREIPQLESVWAWDAELDDWVIAGRNAPEWLGGLGRVQAGTGLRLILGGEEPFLWGRSTEPTRGLVELRTGWNLVAWSGADGAPIEQVAKGIGWSLRELRRWNAANQQWATWTSPERSAQLIATSATDQATTDEETEPVTVQRGEALWVNTARSVNWLQPTDILPRLVFPGGASDELQARVREDLEAVLSFYGQQYGIQADPDFTVYVAKDVDALIQAKRDEVYISDAGSARIRGLWGIAEGWGHHSEIVVKQASWPEDLSISDIPRARYLLTHEYFHVLQWHLSGRWFDGDWLIEGAADWAVGEHQVLDGEQTLEDLREQTQLKISSRAPTLRSTEFDNATWEYTLGWLAVDHLAAIAGSASWLEFWRQLLPTEIGPHGRWTATPDWRSVFEEVFGVSRRSFYADFDARQQEQATANGRVASSSDGDVRWIRGRITDESGAPASRMFVSAVRLEGQTDVDEYQQAETDADGAFAVKASKDGSYRIWVDIADHYRCIRHFSGNSELTEELDEAQPVVVDGSDVQGVDIQLPPDTCRWQIRGQVVDDASEPLAGVSVTACPTEGGACARRDSTTHDGSFTVLAPTAGEYRLRLHLADGCTIYYRSGKPTLNFNEATLIRIADRDVSGLQLQVPSDLCNRRVTGSIEGIERFLHLDGGTWVTICQVVSTQCRASGSRELVRNGPFAIAVPAAGSYQIEYRLGNYSSCFLYHGPTGLTSNTAEAMRFDAGDRDVRIGYRQVPNTMCAYQISGTIVDTDGAPLIETWLWACERANDKCASSTFGWTDSDGSFAITVPVNGAYRLRFSLDGCTVYLGRDGLTSNVGDAWLIRVDGRDVQVSQRQVPAGLCRQ